jgi:hypothetical protein
VFEMPEIKTTGDAVKAASALVSAVAGGEMTPAEAAEVGKLIESYVRTLEAAELEDRLMKLEARQSQ